MTEFDEFIKLFDPTRKLEFYNALKKLSMRCLFANLDETQELRLYLSRKDFWPIDYEANIKEFTDKLPKSIKLEHTLGNMIDSLTREFDPNCFTYDNSINNDASSNFIKNEDNYVNEDDSYFY